MGGGIDLLGDPVPENWGKRGRPAHVATEENRIKIRVLLGFGWTNTRIAHALRISASTLKAHYSADLRYRHEARDALKAARLVMVYRAAAEGNVGAMKELGKLIEADDRQAIQDAFGDDAGAKSRRQPAPPRMGKKEAALAEARALGEGVDPDWGEDLNPGSATIN